MFCHFFSLSFALPAKSAMWHLLSVLLLGNYVISHTCLEFSFASWNPEMVCLQRANLVIHNMPYLGVYLKAFLFFHKVKIFYHISIPYLQLSSWFSFWYSLLWKKLLLILKSLLLFSRYCNLNSLLRFQRFWQISDQKPKSSWGLIFHIILSFSNWKFHINFNSYIAVKRTKKEINDQTEPGSKIKIGNNVPIKILSETIKSSAYLHWCQLKIQF